MVPGAEAPDARVPSTRVLGAEAPDAAVPRGRGPYTRAGARGAEALDVGLPGARVPGGRWAGRTAPNARTTLGAGRVRDAVAGRIAGQPRGVPAMVLCRRGAPELLGARRTRRILARGPDRPPKRRRRPAAPRPAATTLAEAVPAEATLAGRSPGASAAPAGQPAPAGPPASTGHPATAGAWPSRPGGAGRGPAPAGPVRCHDPGLGREPPAPGHRRPAERQTPESHCPGEAGGAERCAPHVTPWRPDERTAGERADVAPRGRRTGPRRHIHRPERTAPPSARNRWPWPTAPAPRTTRPV